MDDPTCRQCGRPLVGRTARATFCSVTCKEQDRTARRRATLQVVLASKVCVHCGGPMAHRSSKAVVCSTACGVAYQNGRRSVAAQEQRAGRKCVSCGEPIPTDRMASATYCSKRCRVRVQSVRRRGRQSDYMRQYLYGITPAEYVALLESQGGRCAVCRTDVPGGKGGWHVDHDHATGRVRGVLCNNCNQGLGRFMDDPTRLRAALGYLERGGP
jgi:predicted nucleic acid-binding Zn ribbon protein